jgi:hypothetical protein
MSTSSSPFGVTHLVTPTGEDSVGWWSSYSKQLTAHGISPTSLKVIDDDAQFIIDEGVFGAGSPGSGAWPHSRERSGVVLGAVQSGKTASMLAVIAKALDAKVDAIVVLAGTRTALWQQTFERLVSQLDTFDQPWTKRVFVPNRAVLNRGQQATDLATLYALTGPLGRKAVSGRVPIVAVVMKNVFHLERMAATLRKSVFPAAAQRGDPFHILVIDDEADDSSILDAVTEARTGVSLADTKQVPRRIADLWEARTSPGETSHANLYATYIAYTATPQANFLQDASNPLAPRDFAISLRTPGPRGELEPRSPSYTDAAGLKSWYTGGDMFYKSLSSLPLCRTEDPPDEVFGNAIRAFLVGSAVRLWRAPERIGPHSARGHRFGTKAEALSCLAAPGSMLIHPSSAKDDHFDVAAQVLAWSDGSDRREGRARIHAGERELSVEGIQTQIDDEPEKWRSWIREFADGAQCCYTALSLPEKASVPGIDDWDEIRRLLLEEVVPGTRVAVINSDETADDRPDFEPRLVGDTWGPPPNHSTMFVSGNVMARGLTLEGLTTTLFTRHSDAPLADTQMQMQRWFGYRGSFIELCRVFLTPGQLRLFNAYNETDEALRRDIMAAMNQPGGPSTAVSVLQGYNFAATGKIANVTPVAIWPEATPFVRHMNPPESDSGNAEVVAALLSRGCDVVSAKDGRDLGLILREDLDLLGAAELLDNLTYRDHGPGASGRDSQRWQSLANHLGLTAQDSEYPLYRAPFVPEGIDLGSNSPYAIAAYLRAWSAALSRRAPGLVTTDPPFGPWSLVDLQQRAAARPSFRVALRFGRGPRVASGPLANLGHPVRTMKREITDTGALRDTWGSRGSAGTHVSDSEASERFPGDEYIDYFARGEPVPIRASWGSARPPGEPGLVLFHPIAHDNEAFSLAVGLSLPLGGPDQVSALPAENLP